MRKKQLLEQINYLEKELQKAENELEEYKKDLKIAEELLKTRTKYIHEYDQIIRDLEKYKNNLTPIKIIHNNNATIVWFNDEKIVVKCCIGDTNSIYTAVSYAIAKKIFKTNTNFKRKVDKLINEK